MSSTQWGKLGESPTLSRNGNPFDGKSEYPPQIDALNTFRGEKAA